MTTSGASAPHRWPQVTKPGNTLPWWGCGQTAARQGGSNAGSRGAATPTSPVCTDLCDPALPQKHPRRAPALRPAVCHYKPRERGSVQRSPLSTWKHEEELRTHTEGLWNTGWGGKATGKGVSNMPTFCVKNRKANKKLSRNGIGKKKSGLRRGNKTK